MRSAELTQTTQQTVMRASSQEAFTIARRSSNAQQQASALSCMHKAGVSRKHGGERGEKQACRLLPSGTAALVDSDVCSTARGCGKLHGQVEAAR